ncbi:NADPH-dependent FMN reductase [Flavobacterium aquicola]|uniref:NAD(P)H-dependent FMN reductase n=1 Tax=Flavobacterium aquicola TaxID=1682742 RepID=A0A3E0ETD1_9FLAO|nr:NADPH-dependent FMN reductase [Flavobacterium aquicola]REH00921.1 NAD(P)H-dependent FMN reductase [Flavobacterium aquicola]
MSSKKNIFVIIGSASKNSANEKIIDLFINQTNDYFSFNVFKELKTLPHFDPELSAEKPPQAIIEFRNNIEKADGIVICSPEYIFSIPSGLKNAIEWCVSTTVFTEKATGLITASASGEKAHEELQLIMKTMMAKFTNETTLLIQGAKGKITEQGQLNDDKTKAEFSNFIEAFRALIVKK